MKKSLKNDISDYLRVVSPEWRTKDAIERFAQEKGYLADNAARRARELSESKPNSPPPMIIKDPYSKYTRYQFNAKDYPTNTVHIFSVAKNMRKRSEYYRNQAMLF